MALTDELIEFCRKSLGELERIIANSEGHDGASYRDKHEEYLDWRFHVRAKGLWQKWHGALNLRLESLGIPTLPIRWNRSVTELTPFAVFERPLKSIQERADGGSLEALEALCQLAIFSARGIQQLRRVEYIRKHPYPWQKRAVTSAVKKVTDAEVSTMLKELSKDISTDGQDGEGSTPES